jgi:serine protease Do
MRTTGACLAPVSAVRTLLPTVLALLALAAGGVRAPDALAAGGYRIAPAPAANGPDESLELLKKVSHGVAEIAKKANQAIVFVSVYKNAQQAPYGMVDPFDFFFGPRRGDQGDQGGGGGGRHPDRREGGLGSGFFIDVERGYVLTNNHVVQGADEIQLKLPNGETYEGKIVGRDLNTDVAVVQVKNDKFNRTGLAQLYLGDSDVVSVGDFVVALGAPYGLEASLSFGVVSALGRGNLDITKLGNFIQTDAAINPGNSGGPLLSMAGEVVGINTAIYSRSGGYNGIGFAVPANLVRNVAEQLINDGRLNRGYLGVYLQPIDPELHSGFNLPATVKGGAVVARVAPAGPADKAGIEPGDVITEVNGSAMKDNGEVVTAIGLIKPGTAVTLKVYRDGKSRDAKVVVGQHPEDEASAGGGPAVAQGRGKELPFGLTLANPSKALKDKFAFESDGGVVATSVEPDSTGDRAGLRAGDLILKIDGKKVGNVEEFKKLVKGKSKLLVWIERAGEFFFVQLRSS